MTLQKEFSALSQVVAHLRRHLQPAEGRSALPLAKPWRSRWRKPCSPLGAASEGRDIERLNRTKELVTVDVPASDLRYEARATLSLRPLPWLSIDASGSRRKMLSSAGSLRGRATLVEHGLTTRVHF